MKGALPVTLKALVLVVDDDPDLLRLVSLLLARINVDVQTAQSATIAAQYLTERLPDLMILDLMMPEISGLDFLRQLRGHRAYETLPVLVLSALIDPEQIRIALSEGADRYLTKPYITHNLLSVVQEMLQSGRRRD